MHLPYCWWQICSFWTHITPIVYNSSKGCSSGAYCWREFVPNLSTLQRCSLGIKSGGIIDHFSAVLLQCARVFSVVLYFLWIFVRWGLYISFRIRVWKLVFIVSSINVISYFFGPHAPCHQHTPTSKFHRWALCSHCGRSTANMLETNWSKQIYFGFIWPKKVLPAFIQLSFMFFGSCAVLLCLVRNGFLLGHHVKTLTPCSVLDTVWQQSLNHQFPLIICVPSSYPSAFQCKVM